MYVWGGERTKEENREGHWSKPEELWGRSRSAILSSLREQGCKVSGGRTTVQKQAGKNGAVNQFLPSAMTAVLAWAMADILPDAMATTLACAMAVTVAKPPQLATESTGTPPCHFVSEFTVGTVSPSLNLQFPWPCQ